MTANHFATNHEKSEELILDSLNRMGLDKINEYQIKDVSLNYQPVSDSSKNDVSFVFLRDGTLEIVLQYSSLEMGVKYMLAKFAWDFKAKHIFVPHRRSTIPAILPIITFIPPMMLFGEVALGDLGLSLLLGPILYALITLPLLLILSKKKQEDNNFVRNRLQECLVKAEIYRRNEIDELVSTITNRLPLYHFVEYVLFVPLFSIFMWMVFYLNMNP